MKLLTPPEASSYSLQFPKEGLAVELDGGRSRFRKDILNGAVKISPTFILNPDDYDYFMAFYRRQSQNGSETFDMDLIVENTGLVTCEVNIIPGSLKLGEQRGLAYTVSCDLEVVPPFDAGQAADDDAIIAAYNTAHGYTP